MPKAAAMRPQEWATVYMEFGAFDLGELDRVVIDYGHIELQAAKRWSRRTGLGRFCDGLLQCVKVIGLMAAVLLALVAFTVTDGEALLPLVCAAAGLGCAAVVAWYVPWALTPYRQWDRTLSGISVMMIVCAAAATVAMIARERESSPVWMLALPCVVLLLTAVGALVGVHRFYNREKPPAVDLAALTPEEVEVLLESRRKALKVLRSRSAISYADFRVFDAEPLLPPREA